MEEYIERERERGRERDERTDREWKLYSLCDNIKVEQSRFKICSACKIEYSDENKN